MLVSRWEGEVLEYLFQILGLIGIYAIAAMSLDLLAGQAGIMSVCHAAFLGVGAYGSALMAIRCQTPFLLNLAVGVGLAAAIAAMVAMLSARLEGESFVIATFAFQLVVTSTLNNWTSVTGGPAGLPGVPPPAALGFRITSRLGFSVVVGACAAATAVLYHRVSGSPFGRVLRCIRMALAPTPPATSGLVSTIDVTVPVGPRADSWTEHD